MGNWRLIIDPDLSGRRNMAVDSALVGAAAVGCARGPVVRIYGWVEPTISIGYAQDAGPFMETGLPVVRRISGGRAVLHDSEITYSITAGSDSALFAGGIAAAYQTISRCIVDALGAIGVQASLSRGARHAGGARAKEACFYAPSRSEVLVGGKKLVGSSQRRFRGAFLQHGSILYSIDPQLNGRVFGHGVVERMTCISDVSTASRDVARDALVKSFAKGLGVVFSPSELTPEEEALAEDALSDAPGARAGGGREGMERGAARPVSG